MTSDADISTTADPRDADPKNTDPKTAEDGTPIERTVPPEQWEAVGRRALATLVEERTLAVDEAVGELVSAIRYGAPVDETHLEHLRDAIAGLESVTEHDLTDLVEGGVPFERTAGRVPFGRMADALGVEVGDLNRALELAEGTDAAAEAGS